MISMKKTFTYADVLAELQRVVGDHPTQRAAAAALEISPQYLQDLIKGTRRITETVARKLGFLKTEDTYLKAS